jgi:uncharacterized membrane protein SirB2
MTTLTLIQAAQHSQALASTLLVARLRAWLELLRRRQQRRELAHSLGHLSDRMLADVGLQDVVHRQPTLPLRDFERGMW